MLVGSVGRICSLLPFSLSELLLLIFLAGLLGWLGVAFWQLSVLAGSWLGRTNRGGFKNFWRRSAAVALRVCIVLFALFTFQCGINYHRQTFSQRAGFVMAESTKEELVDLCWALTEELNQAAGEITVDENGACRLKENLEERARAAMLAAAQEYPELSGYYPRAKGVWNSWALSYQQLLGIYSPFTIESNYNRDMPEYNKPSAICHELSHLKGFMREDEANFIAYLACRASQDEDFRYSGSMLAYVYSMNALYRADRDLYREIRTQLCSQAERELELQNAFWNAYEGPVAEVSNKMNDTYLKVNAQGDGTRSYGRMVDLLLALRRSKIS